MNRKIHYIVWLFAAFLAVGCEDLADTYDEYTGDGKIHYVGKCSDLEVETGWYRLIAKWKGSLDAGIDSVKVTWRSEVDSVAKVRYLAPPDVNTNPELLDSTILDGLGNYVYTITVSGVTADGQESLVETQYARPYTEEHEDLNTFTRGIVNFYRLGNKLALFLDEDNENIISANLVFYNTDGERCVWDFKQWMWNILIDWNTGNEIYVNAKLLPDDFAMDRNPEWADDEIDFDRPITIERTGLLSGCIDTITFNPVELDATEIVWSAGISQLMEKRYGSDWQSKVDDVEEIELDYSMSTIQDLMYFPKLKEVIIGKNRYMVDGQNESNLSTTNAYAGLMTLKFLKDTRDVKVTRYNKHYFSDNDIQFLIDNGIIMDASELIDDRGNTNRPEAIVPLDTTGWEVTCSDSLANGYEPNGAAYLLTDDNSLLTQCFEPPLKLQPTVFEVEFDMQTPRTLHGFKVMQPGVETQTPNEYLVSSVKVEVSDDGYEWELATYEDGTNIGNSLGETTMIRIPEELQDRQIRYIRLTIANKAVGTLDGRTTYSLRLGSFIPY